MNTAKVDPTIFYSSFAWNLLAYFQKLKNIFYEFIFFCEPDFNFARYYVNAI